MQANPHPEADPASAPPPSPPPAASSQSLQTAVLHADAFLNTSADVAPPLHVSTTFSFNADPSKLVPDRDATPMHWFAPEAPYIYSRETAPNATRLEAILASAIGAPAIAYGSGQAAIFAAYTLLAPKKVAITAGYHGAHGALRIMQRLTGLQMVGLEEAERELGQGDVLHVETPVNPTGECRDLARFAEVARRRGAVLLVDATLGPPPLQDPLAMGVDMVMHSGTKYFGGHSDMLLGVLATRNQDWLRQLAMDRLYMGNVAGSLEAWLGVRSLRTLAVRVERQSSGATQLVAWLHDALNGAVGVLPGSEAVAKVVDKVFHSSLQARESGNEWIARQMPGGWGPLFAFTAKSEALARKLPSKLGLFLHATSLGGVESLIEWRAMSDNTCDPKILRVSVGIERWEDLRDDLIQAFEALVKEEGL